MLTNRSGSLQTIASASAPHASAWPAAASRTRGGRRPCHRAEAVRAAGAGGGAAPLSAIEIEVAGRRVLAAWNSRLSRRARQLLSGERPANGGGPSSGGAASAGAACAAAALDLLAATVRAQAPEAPLSNPSSSEHTAPGVSGVSGTALGVLVPWAACPQALEPLLTHREVDATLVAVEPSYDGADAIQRRFGLLPPDGVAHDGWERFKPAGNASGGGAGSSTAGGGAGSSGAGGGGGGRVMLYRGSPYLLTPPVLSLATDVDAVWDRWGLLLTPPELRGSYLRTMARLLTRQRGGALAFAAHIRGQGCSDGSSGLGAVSPTLGDAGSDALDGLHAISEDELGELAAATEEAAGLRLVRQAPLPPGSLPGDNLAHAPGNTLLLFEPIH